MFEAEKLCESEYFFQRMVQEQSDYKNFVFNLSAFLSATRSVLQYVLEEAKSKEGGRTWYDTTMAGSPVLQYFKDKRDSNIHMQPINPSKQFDVHISNNISVVITGQEKKSPEEKQQHRDIIVQSLRKLSSLQELTMEEKELLNKCTINTEKLEAKCEETFGFYDWKGPENALKLCEKYLRTLDAVVTEGHKKGFVTI